MALAETRSLSREDRNPLIDPVMTEKSRLFFERIERPDLEKKLTALTPWTIVTAEYFDEKVIKGQGGLGMLVSDTARVARDLGVPAVIVTPLYPSERRYEIVDFRQNDIERKPFPEERGFKKEGIVSITTLVHTEIPLDVYVRRDSSVSIVTLSEPNFGFLYDGNNNGDHRLYQKIALGFGGFKALELLKVEPSITQLNEASTVFSALARFDKYLSEDRDFKKAFKRVLENTVYTNHTLVQAAEPEFSLQQFEHFVIPNIAHEELKKWLRNQFAKKDRIKLSSLAIALSGRINGVSRTHAREASRTYNNGNGGVKEGISTNFEAITNGISLERWCDPILLNIYKKEKVIDQFGLPADEYIKGIGVLDEGEIMKIKKEAKMWLLDVLRQRKDQYGGGVIIPQDAFVYNWRRRLADYKRPDFLFSDPFRLAQILEEENIHFVISGNAHPTDEPMKERLNYILKVIDENPILKSRVHFIQDYDEDLSRALAQGADVSVNTPVVRKHELNEEISSEASGTSGMKDAINGVILISTSDGWFADPKREAEAKGEEWTTISYLEIKGTSHEEEVKSLYSQIKRSADIIKGKDSEFNWGQFIKRQLGTYLPIISGSRMLGEYLNRCFDQ